ncbi:hypothetical protein ROLI_033540 [Roseobacter fucihabitans]|uniref:Uncharacterized protein n=2 Tax=Roseobacter fucihabitans TaxID=1537242 RepID=A0ABZ2BW18_9RHOB|nr:hypothetical protein [Roseobacter litoralis]
MIRCSNRKKRDPAKPDVHGSSLSNIDVERLHFFPRHVPPEHKPSGTINSAREKIYGTLVENRLQQKDKG